MSSDCPVGSSAQTPFLIISDFSIDLSKEAPPGLALALPYKGPHIGGYSYLIIEVDLFRL